MAPLVSKTPKHGPHRQSRAVRALGLTGRVLVGPPRTSNRGKAALSRDSSTDISDENESGDTPNVGDDQLGDWDVDLVGGCFGREVEHSDHQLHRVGG